MSDSRQEMPKEEKNEEKLLRFSFVCSLVFTITEIAMAIVLHSYSIMMDGVFDVADLVLLGPFLVLVPLLYRPVTEKHPYGYAQFESVFLIVKYGVLLIVTVTMIYANIREIMEGGHTVAFNSIGLYELVIGLLCVVIYLILRRYSRRQASPSVRAELDLWKQDIAGSMGVAAAFFSQTLLKNTPARRIVPYMDSLVAIVMALFLIREPIHSLIEGFRSLVLFAPDEEASGRIREIVSEVLEGYPYECSFLDMIKTGRKYWIEVYISPDRVTGAIDVRSWASIRTRMELLLREEFQQVYIELIPDIPDHLEENLSALEATRE